MYDRLRRELSYVEGLLEGSNTNNSNEAKILVRLTSVLDELVDATKKLDVRQTELEGYIEAVDEDLNDLEILTYDRDVEDDDDDTLLITCPECKEDVLVTIDDLDDEEIDLVCPNCDTILKIEDTDKLELINSEES